MAITTNDFGSFLDAGVKRVQTVMSNLNKNSFYRKLMRVGTTQIVDFKVQDVENMAAAQFWTEGSPRPMMSFKKGFAQSFTQHQWAALLDITKAFRKFNQQELMTRLMSQLKMAPTKAKEIIAAAYFEYGHTGATVPIVGGLPLINANGGDGQAIFSANHPHRSMAGNTWTNYFTPVSADLTETTFDTYRTVIRRWKDNTGSPLDIKAKRVIIDDSIEGKAIKIFLAQYEPATANNAPNTANRFATAKDKYLVFPWLTVQGDWYIETDATEGDIEMYFGWDDETESGPNNRNPLTGNECVSVDFSVAHGCLLCRRYLAVK